MASNFKINIATKRNEIDLKLTGDFDGTSAYELINTLKECPADISKIFIHTNGLKIVFPFGRDLFRKFLFSIDSQPSRFEFKGTEAFALSSEKESPSSNAFRSHPT